MTPRRRLSDLLADTQLVLMQLMVLQQESGPHHPARLQMRIAALHRRLDGLERTLRLRAAEKGVDGQTTLGQLRRVLATLTDRRQHSYGRRVGPERRRGERRHRTTAGVACC